jgi:imidazolonepropionase-like amidohydrolase
MLSRPAPVRGDAVLLALAALLAAAAPARAQWSPQGGVVLEGKVVTMDDAGDVLQGGLYVQNGVIQQLLPPGAPPPAGALEIDTHGGYIYPGLINLHNHMTYDYLPPYPVPQDYGDRDQWPTALSYAEYVKFPTDITTGKDAFDYETEAVKYALVKEIAGGTTSVQGAPNLPGAALLARSVEWDPLGQGSIASRTFAVDQQFVTDLAQNQQTISGLQAWFFHLAEGKDAHARIEYSNPAYDPNQPVDPNTNRPGLKELGLVLPSLVGIHCTALTEADFADWQATTGVPKVVWSPLSNLMLYGETTDVLAARNHGAVVCLGTDWTPSGSKNLLWELKVADQWNAQKLGGALTTEDLAWMVTRFPAWILGWQGSVGEIAQGMVGDLVVTDDLGSGDPYRNLIDATEANVQLVLVGGEPLYGDAGALSALKGASALEPLAGIPGRPKLLDLQRPSLPQGSESLADIAADLDAALADDAAALAAVLNAGDPTQPDPFTAREAVATALASQYQATALPPELRNPASQPITAADCASYLREQYPGAHAYPAADAVFELTDSDYFAAVKANLHLSGPAAVLDLTPLDRYRQGGGAAPAPSAAGGAAGAGAGAGAGATAGGGGAAGSGAAPSSAVAASAPGGGSGGGCTFGRGGEPSDLLPPAIICAALALARRFRR